MLAIHAKTGKTIPHVSTLKMPYSVTFTIAVKKSSLLRKPLNGGSPAIAANPIKETVAVIGMSVIKPPSLRISRVPVS